MHLMLQKELISIWDICFISITMTAGVLFFFWQSIKLTVRQVVHHFIQFGVYRRPSVFFTLVPNIVSPEMSLTNIVNNTHVLFWGRVVLIWWQSTFFPCLFTFLNSKWFWLQAKLCWEHLRISLLIWLETFFIVCISFAFMFIIC